MKEPYLFEFLNMKETKPILEKDLERIICDSGLQKSKLSLPSNYLLKLNNAEVLENLAKE